MQPIPPITPLSVVLEAQQWNIVMAALRKMPYEVVEALMPIMDKQFEEGAARVQQTNGVDRAPLAA